jgi:hypothetical protein
MRILAAFVVMASATLALADSTVPEPSSGASVMLSLERTACFGRCPIYTVTVLRDGTVRWEGKQFVKVSGKATAKLSAATLAALADAFKRAGYFALADQYENHDMTDGPTAIMSYADGAKKKTIRHYHGDSSAPQKLSQLESRIDELVGTVRWIGR